MRAGRLTGHVLVVRLDSLGDVLVTGPAVRAVARTADRVTMLVGPRGLSAARLLPGVDDIAVFAAPWIGPDHLDVDPDAVDDLVDDLRDRRVDAALVVTSFHQSPLPMALLLRLAGVPWIGAMCEDFPGSLLDLRMRPPGDIPEARRALALAEAAGARPDAAGSALAVRTPLPPSPVEGTDFVVLHPGASAPARCPDRARSRAFCAALVAAGHRVVVTGGPGEDELVEHVSDGLAGTLIGASLPELAATLAAARVVVAPNTGPAHLAAAVGTPVVSLFSPVVPRARWQPHGVPTVVLGDPGADCAGTRARDCPVPGHPCLDGIAPDAVVAAVEDLWDATAPSPDPIGVSA